MLLKNSEFHWNVSNSISAWKNKVCWRWKIPFSHIAIHVHIPNLMLGWIKYRQYRRIHAHHNAHKEDHNVVNACVRRKQTKKKRSRLLIDFSVYHIDLWILNRHYLWMKMRMRWDAMDSAFLINWFPSSNRLRLNLVWMALFWQMVMWLTVVTIHKERKKKRCNVGGQRIVSNAIYTKKIMCLFVCLLMWQNHRHKTLTGFIFAIAMVKNHLMHV